MGEILSLFYGYSGENMVEAEDVNGDFYPLAHNITIQQVMNVAKMFTRKYDTVRLYDSEYEAFIAFGKGSKPFVDTYYPEDYTDVAKKYGLYVQSDDIDQTDLDKEKWDNYWNDYNQCGIRVDY